MRAGCTIAAKVTTPEYVVDKATKLETLYNRIHEIRTRFEVVKRENEVAMLRGFIKGGNSLREVERQIVEFNAVIDQEYAVIAEANIGGGRHAGGAHRTRQGNRPAAHLDPHPSTTASASPMKR